MNMRETIAFLQSQVDELKAKIVQQDLDYSNLIEVKNGQIEQQARVNACNTETAEVEFKKKLESVESNRKYYSEEASRKQQEIDAVHDILDVIPNIISREKETDYGKRPNSLMVRLASALASRQI